MHSFSTPGKHQKILRFFNIFRGEEKVSIEGKWVKFYNRNERLEVASHYVTNVKVGQQVALD